MRSPVRVPPGLFPSVLPPLLFLASSCASSPQDVKELVLPDQFHVFYGLRESDLDNRTTPSRGFDEEGDTLEFGLTWDLSEPEERERGITRADLLWLVEEMRARERSARPAEPEPPPPEAPAPEAAVEEAPAEPEPAVEVALVESAPPPEPEGLLPPPPPEESAPEEAEIPVLEAVVAPEVAPPEPVEELPIVEDEPRAIETVLPAVALEPALPPEPPVEKDRPWGDVALAGAAGLAGVLLVVLAIKLPPKTAAS